MFLNPLCENDSCYHNYSHWNWVLRGCCINNIILYYITVLYYIVYTKYKKIIKGQIFKIKKKARWKLSFTTSLAEFRPWCEMQPWRGDFLHPQKTILPVTGNFSEDTSTLPSFLPNVAVPKTGFWEPLAKLNSGLLTSTAPSDKCCNHYGKASCAGLLLFSIFRNLP